MTFLSLMLGSFFTVAAFLAPDPLVGVVCLLAGAVCFVVGYHFLTGQSK